MINKFCKLLFLLLVLYGFQKADDIIYWSPVRKLTWDDFKEVERCGVYGATSCDGIDYELLNNENAVKIISFFNKKKSWVVKGEKDNEGIKHEQVHFDITEVYARKLRKAIKDKKFKKKHLAEDLMLIYKEIDNALGAYQKVYDKETDNYRNQVKQDEWNKKIENELQELKDYSETKVEIKLK